MYVVIGAGVVGLTTALELKTRKPDALVIVTAKFLPGDSDSRYASAWAGANWLSAANDGGREEDLDAVTYNKFKQLATERPDAGIFAMDIRCIYDSPIETTNILSKDNKLWYDALVGGVKDIPTQDLPTGAVFGYEFPTFVVDVQRYLPWLQFEALKQGINIDRAEYDHIEEVMKRFPKATAFFNCTGLGALSLGGVEDKAVFPARGQTLLIEGPSKRITKMHFRSATRSGTATHVFPRGTHGGIVLGGCRQTNNWSGEVDLDLAEDIKRRCCALVPELGKPEDLKVIKHGVGLRPGREGGARIEEEMINGKRLIHSYGAGGTGYQASWGMAKHAVDLLSSRARL